MLRLGSLAVFLLALMALPVFAGESPVIAESSYVSGFLNHWSGTFAKRNSIVVGVLIAGAIGIFIITRGKKLK